VNRRFCLALDLKDDPGLIAEYERHHEHVWPEIIENIKTSGIEDMEIYRLGTRMFMIMEVNEKFSFEAKSKADQSNPKVAEREVATNGQNFQTVTRPKYLPLHPNGGPGPCRIVFLRSGV
jgi:L-rhamnose mutarotase